jgi:aspartate-semialdehyde dehydrogenase|tara:strand:+ start:62058 stop:63071 length:1014 start_codon:yes stop_codon:yes gene_type:complete
MGYKVAVVGATGNVGREILKTLDERGFAVDEIHALASPRSAGRELSFGKKDLKVKGVDDFDFKGIDFAFFAAGSKVSAKFALRAAEAGAVVIDNTSHFRMDPDVPLVVPEVNPYALKDFKKKNIVANPNCSTIQMMVALKPLHDLAIIKRVVVSTYQSVSGGGKSGMDELFNQTRGIYANDYPTPEVHPKQIAFNCIPQIDVFMDDHMTREEWKMVVETKKILDPKIKVCASCVRVPVFVGHAEMINVEFENEITAVQAKQAWHKAEGIQLIDLETEIEYVTPVEIAGEDNVYVSRLREDITVENGLNFWCVADNLRKGAALNAIQIAEKMIEMKLK